MEHYKIQLLERILQFRRKSFLRIGSRYLEPKNQNIAKKIELKNQEKGTEFEKFVVKLFNPDYFHLIEWRSDKSIDGIFPLMSKFPDLEFYFESKTESFHFAVECKWREHFYKECVELNKFHLENYRVYEELTGNVTFIVIGIGNTPSAPKQVYIVPLSEITREKIHEFELEIFRRSNPHDNFFIDCSRNLLR